MKSFEGKDYIAAFFIALFVVCVQLNLMFGNFINFPDNINYINGYNGLDLLDLKSGYLLFIQGTGGGEPLSYFIFYFFAQWFDYSTFIFIIDVVFIFCLTLLYRRLGINFFIIIIFVLCNYYVFVLDLYLQRLKLATLFVVLGLLLTNKKKGAVSFVLAPLAHFQILTVYLPVFLSNFFSRLMLLRINLKSLLVILLSMSFVIVGLFYLNLQAKVTAYLGDIYIKDAIFCLVLSACFLLWLRIKNLGVVFYFLFLALEILFVNGTRMNIVLFFSFLLFAAITDKKKFIQLNAVYSLYSLYKIYGLYGQYLECT